MSPALTLLIDALADVFETEESHDGRIVAEALRDHRSSWPAFDLRTLDLIAETQDLCLARGALPAAGFADSIWMMLPWYHPGLGEDDIPNDMARRILSCEILGPDGLIQCADVRVGLLVQSADIAPPVRALTADQTCVTLAGRASWQTDGCGWRSAGPGEHVHHPAMTPHRCRSDAGQFLAAWRWTGDIGWGNDWLDRLASAA